MSKKEMDCINCNCKADIFKYLTEEELMLTNEHKTVVRYKAGESIFKQGSPCNHVVSFVKGQALIYLEGSAKKDVILGLVKPTEFISGTGMHSDGIHHFSVRTLVDSTVCFIEGKIVIKLIRSNRIFAKSFMDQHHRLVISLFDKLTGLTTKNQLGRMAGSLIDLGKFYGSNSFDLTLSRDELASMANVSRESAYRLLSGLANDKVIRQYNGSIEILKQDQLLKISKNG